MDYPPEAFDALITEVERQGGALLPDICESQDVIYTVPPYATPNEFEEATCGCNNESMMVTIYDTSIPKKIKARQAGTGFARACAVCDEMGAWPRYCEAVYAADPDLRPEDPEDPEDDSE